MKQKSIKKNMLMSVVLTSSNFIFPLITYSYVARVLTPVGTGKVAFVSSVLGYFTYISTLGVPSYGLRECAKVRDDRNELSQLVQELLLISLIATLVCYVLLFISVAAVPKLYEYRQLFVIMGVSIMLNSIGVEWFYQSLEEYSYITIRSLVFKAISVVLAFLLINDIDDYLWYGVITIFTSSASYLLNFFHLRKHISFRKNKNYNLRRHIKPVLILFASSVVLTIYNNFDVTMIGFIQGEREVGLYNSALRVKSIVLSFSSALTAVIIPRIAFYFKDRKTKEISELLTKSFQISLIIAIPVAAYIFIFSKDVLLFLAGAEYIEAEWALKVLVICIIPLVMTNLCGNQILIPSGNEKRYTQSVFVGLIINIVLNSILIPNYGAFGAAIGTLAAEVWNVIWMSSGAKEYFFGVIKNTRWYYLVSLLVASLAAIGIHLLIRADGVFIKLLITSLFFFGSYYIFLIWVKEPIVYSNTKSVSDHMFSFFNKANKGGW